MYNSPQLPLSQLLNHAGQLHRAGNLANAASVYRQILRQQPRNAQVLGRLGQVLIGLGQLDEAKRSIDQALRLSPKAPSLFHDLSLLHRRKGEIAKAHECLDKALRLAPRQPIFTASKADLFMSNAEWDRAMKTLEPVLSTAGQIAPVAMALTSLAPRYGREAEAIAALRTNIANVESGPVIRMRAAFALAHLLDWTGDFAGAVDAAEIGNSLHSRDWDAAAHRLKVDACIAAWTREAAAALPRAGVDASDLVLIVGMPRCGNLLVARMLSATKGTKSVGEQNDLLAACREFQGGTPVGAPVLTEFMGCTPNAMTERASAYLTRMRTAHPDAKRLIDRNPMNLLGLGLASRMLPGARVIHCRRDPADSAVSCWFASFGGVLPFMYDKETVGGFQRDADRLMAHWKSALDTPFLDVDYDELCLRPEATARRIVEFVGAEWSDGVLDPARNWVSTIAQPDGTMRDLYPEGRPGLAKDYEALLPPLFEALRG